MTPFYTGITAINQNLSKFLIMLGCQHRSHALIENFSPIGDRTSTPSGNINSKQYALNRMITWRLQLILGKSQFCYVNVLHAGMYSRALIERAHNIEKNTLVRLSRLHENYGIISRCYRCNYRLKITVKQLSRFFDRRRSCYIFISPILHFKQCCAK